MNIRLARVRPLFRGLTRLRTLLLVSILIVGALLVTRLGAQELPEGGFDAKITQVGTSPSKFQSILSNTNTGTFFRFDWPTGTPTGWAGYLRPATFAGQPVGIIWQWETTQLIFPKACNPDTVGEGNSCVLFTPVFGPTPGGNFAVTGVTLADSGSRSTDASLTTTLLTFFSPPEKIFEHTAGVSQTTNGEFEYNTRIQNFSLGTLTVEIEAGPAECDTCINLEDDERNCGSCGNACGPGECCLDNDGPSCEPFPFGEPCPVCGNGILEVGEECDGDDIGDASCFDYDGYCGGEPSCSPTCTLLLDTCAVACGAECCVASQCISSDPDFCASFASPDAPDAGETVESKPAAASTEQVDCPAGFDSCDCESPAYEATCDTGICDGTCLTGPRFGDDCSTALDCSLCTAPSSSAGSICVQDSDCNPVPICRTGACLEGQCEGGLFDGESCSGDYECGSCHDEFGRKIGCISDSDCILAESGGTTGDPHGSRSTLVPTKDGSIRSFQVEAMETIPLTCQQSPSPAKEISTVITVCFDEAPESGVQCSDGRYGVRGTANIFVPDETMQIDFVNQVPFIASLGTQIVEPSGNGIIDPGEEVQIFITLANSGGGTLSNVSAVLSAPDEDVNGDGVPDPVLITTPSADYDDLVGIVPDGSTPDCGQGVDANLTPETNAQPFVVVFPAGHPAGVARTFELAVTGELIVVTENQNEFNSDVDIALAVGGPCVPENLAALCVDQVDNDCDGLIDDADPDCAGLLVKLDSFTATVVDRAVQLDWVTTAEIDTFGFVIYRAESKGRGKGKGSAGDLIPVSGVIPARGSDLQGATYQFVDPNVRPGRRYTYVLEDVGVTDARSRHDPVTVELHQGKGSKGSKGSKSKGSKAKAR